MKGRVFVLLLPLLAATALAASPADAVAAASRDLAAQPADAQPNIRYLSLYHVRDEKELTAWKQCLDFWVNSLSREASLTPLVAVRSDLLRLDLRDYQMNPKTWEKLAKVEPYFHARVKTAVEEYWAGGIYSGDGKHYDAGNYKREKITLAQAPWLDGKQAAALTTMSGSQVPLVRGDWFLVQTSQQVDRKGTGYYDFLGVKNRKDFQELVGLDEAAAVKLQKETRAIVARSGVALQNRQIIRFGSITGSYWVTLDSKKSTEGNNAVRNLNGDYIADAQEIYGTLPSGLFAYYLSDKDGVQADRAPDDIASDKQAPGTDSRVHPGISCIRCHVEGIRPINDWARRVYKRPLSLASPDYEKLKRLRRLYLSDLERWVRRDQADYAETLLKLTGLKPAELAKTFARLHEGYQEVDLDLDALAREAGYTSAHVLAALKAVAKTAGSLDPVLAGLLQDPPEPIRREHMEEVFPLLMTHMRGYVP